MAMTPRLETLLATNPEFQQAYNNGEKWARDHAQMVLGIDGAADRRHPERVLKEDGQTPKRLCSGCPFPEGCMTCDLD